jgi:hypothetical protein
MDRSAVKAPTGAGLGTALSRSEMLLIGATGATGGHAQEGAHHRKRQRRRHAVSGTCVKANEGLVLSHALRNTKPAHVLVRPIVTLKAQIINS